MAKNIQLMIIDPQRSFCAVVPPDQQQVMHDGELCVPGAWDDMLRLGSFIDRGGRFLNDIKVSLDSHRQLHIAHPMWFVNVITNQNPAPFTQMREENGRIIGAVLDFNTMTWNDIGEFTTVRRGFYKRTVEYLKSLKASGRYPHMIWPPHCLIATSGYKIVEPLAEALFRWEKDSTGIVYTVTKGSNMWCEHFSAVQAEVPDPEDPSTQLNTDVIGSLMEADEILLSGEALGHCLANTVTDIANQFAGDDGFIKKCVLLRDCTSSVGGLEHLGDNFIKNMTQRGMRVTTSTDYLA